MAPPFACLYPEIKSECVSTIGARATFALHVADGVKDGRVLEQRAHVLLDGRVVRRDETILRRMEGGIS